MSDNWELRGYYVMACNCDYGCPCNFNARPTPGHCEGVMGFVAEEGRFGSTDIGGVQGAVLAKWPGAIHEGNGVAALFVDDSADEDKRSAFAKIIAGEVGGPMEIFRGTYSLDGPHFAKVNIEVAGKDSEISVESAGRVAFDSIRNPVSGAEVFPRVVLPQGLLTNELEEFTTREYDLNGGGVSLSYPGKTAQIAKINWKSA